MILRDALDIKKGTQQVNKIYKGTYKVWDKNKKALEGYCNQNTTIGKNLLNTFIEDTTIGGVSVSYDKETGILTFNGTATSTENRNIISEDFLTLLAGSYMISLRVVSGSYVYNSSNPESSSIQMWRAWDKSFQIFFSNIEDGFFKFRRDLTEDVTYNKLQYNIRAGDVFNNFKVQIQLEAGTTVTDFEKYTGGVASPSLDYEQPIEVMQGRQIIEIKGQQYIVDLKSKNIFDEDSEWNIIASCGQGNAEGVFPISTGGNRRTFFFYAEPNTSYTISFKTKGDKLGIYEHNSIINPLEYTPNNQITFDNTIAIVDPLNIPDNSYTFTTGTNAKMVAVYYALNTIPTEIQIEEGIKTPYEPYYEYKLAGIGNIKDNFYTDNGKWYLKEIINKYVVNNDLTFNAESTDFINILTPILDDLQPSLNAQTFAELSKCNLLQLSDSTVSSLNGTTATKKIRINLLKTYASTIQEANTVLTNKGLMIYYVKNTPIITEVPATYTTLINQLNALYQAM